MHNCDLWESEHIPQGIGAQIVDFYYANKQLLANIIKGIAIALVASGLIWMLAWYFKPDLSLEECEAKYGHLTEIWQEDNYMLAWYDKPEEEACLTTIEAERLAVEEEAERIRLEEEAAIEAARLAAEAEEWL